MYIGRIEEDEQGVRIRLITDMDAELISGEDGPKSLRGYLRKHKKECARGVFCTVQVGEVVEVNTITREEYTIERRTEDPVRGL